ncbi:MAG: hypothetical protein AVDCRST_MAG03-2830 [uncultured Rubrobacteraceae bacterium]|uniref:Uncharacterized protein n=1 Tax=uncultured Rubrobacteraceae bacterium TaxID=349277 RepID=A0A6J4PW15_9ACTN|nr:MAG: hypothetical protein AVDCRST_MAG03-2830 [uncultured Rubrobacteraceae bacterium]
MRAAFSVLEPDRAQGEFHPDLLARLRQRGQVQKLVRVEVTAPARLEVPAHPGPVLGLEAFGHQVLDQHPTERLGGRVPEDTRRRRIPEDYALGPGVRDDDPVADHLEELAEAQVFRMHASTSFSGGLCPSTGVALYQAAPLLIALGG